MSCQAGSIIPTKRKQLHLTFSQALLYCVRILIYVTGRVMMNDELAVAEGGGGISEDGLFVRAPDHKISQEQGAPDLKARISRYCDK